MLPTCYRRVTNLLPACYQRVTNLLLACSMLQACYQRVTGVLPTCYRRVTGVLTACYRRVTNVLPACYKMLPACYHHVTNVLPACYQLVTGVLPTCYRRVINVLPTCYQQFIWREAIKMNLSVDGKERRLRRPLGKWTIPQNQTRQLWNWYFDMHSRTLLQRDGTTYRIYKATEKETKFDPQEYSIAHRLPRTAIPVTAQEYTIARIPRSHENCNAVNPSQPDTNTFEDYIDRLDDWERNLLRTIGNVRDTIDVTTRIKSSAKTYMVSDGGLINGHGLDGSSPTTTK
jgi:hypothetical protein